MKQNPLIQLVLVRRTNKETHKTNLNKKKKKNNLEKDIPVIRLLPMRRTTKETHERLINYKIYTP